MPTAGLISSKFFSSGMTRPGKPRGFKKFDDRPFPSVDMERIRKDLQELDKDTLEHRARKVAYLEMLLSKKPSHPLFPSHIALNYFDEAKASYVFSNFAATIITCQLAVEEVLKAPYRARGNSKVVNDFNFVQTIEKAREDGFISSNEANELQSMRGFRNILEHPKELSDHRMTVFHDILYPDSAVEKMAERYLRITVELMNSWMRRMNRFRG